MCGGHFARLLIPLAANPAGQAAPIPVVNEVSSQHPCPACGTAITPEFAWCPKCGASLKSHPCAYCGQTISPGDKLCSFCGAPPNKR
ncbi:MAG: zinc ribbon domain-containing protein [Chloroflexi bacterium]|nr:zinc ribbon domain-containing protein [Chloroflexota bacterium]